LSSDSPDQYAIDFDPKQLARLLFLFNIARRNTTSYPGEHPLILRAIQNFLLQLDELLQYSDELTIGVARDTLLAGDATLEKNAVFIDLAQTLFACDIASFTLRRSVTQMELCAFFEVLTRDPSDIRRLGGFSRLLREAGVNGIAVLDIDYRALHTTEMETIVAPKNAEEMEAEELPWDSLIGALMHGELSADGVAGAPGPARRVDPEVLAQMLNEQRQQQPEKAGTATDYSDTITSFFKQLDQEGLDTLQRDDSLRKMSQLIDRLNPELRRHLLNSTFATIGGRTDVAESVLTGLSAETLVEIINDVSDDHIAVPPGLFNLLSKLSRTKTDSEGPARVIGQTSVLSEEMLDERVRTLFRSGNAADFIPPDYQSFLQDILETGKLDDLPAEAVDELRQPLQGHLIETSVMEIILELIDADPMSDKSELLTQNLVDLVNYFVEVGDYTSLVTVYDRLHRHHQESEAFSIPIAEQTLELFQQDEFINTILEGLEIWGRKKHEEIRLLVSHVGAPFVAPIIERLATEKEMAMRQFYMAVLFDMGEPAKQRIVASLHDKRWYLVRNLIVMLRRFNDPTVMTALYRLIGHKHAKVHLEALKTYLHFNDPKTPQYLLRELSSEEIERRKSAAFLARNCAPPPVRLRLSQLLNETANDPDYEVRKIAAKTLADLGDPVCLPEIRKVLLSRNLLRPVLHKEFREQLFSSLPRFPKAAVLPLLEELAADKKGDFATISQQILLSTRRGKP